MQSEDETFLQLNSKNDVAKVKKHISPLKPSLES
jgi:hypothetical protein